MERRESVILSLAIDETSYQGETFKKYFYTDYIFWRQKIYLSQEILRENYWSCIELKY